MTLRLGRVWLLLLWLGCPALAQPLSRSRLLWIDSIPIQVQVSVKSPRGWQPLKPVGRYFEAPSQPLPWQLRLSCVGYRDLDYLVDEYAGGEVVRIPPKGSRIQLQPRIAELMLHTQPTGVQIYLLLSGGERQFLGISGQSVLLNLASVASADGQIHLELQGPDSPASLLAIPAYALYGEGIHRWPPEGCLVLPGARFSRLGWALSSGLVLACGLALFTLMKRRQPEGPVELGGARLGAYRLLERVGRGGSASVFRATYWDSSRQGLFAIKVLHPEILGQNLGLEVVEHEVEPLMRLRHPAIPTVLDWGEDLGRCYLVTPWVDGQSLRQTLSAGKLPWNAVHSLLLQLLQALQSAHEQGILHADLKPENLLVDARGRLHLIDFGLACHSGPACPLSGGTPGYLAPERLSGQPPSVTSDLFAVGRIAEELLAESCDSQISSWLRWLTHPQAELRPSSCEEALEHLPYP